MNNMNKKANEKAKPGEEIKLIPFPECNDVNPWACWEGGRRHLDAKVLLVGQDLFVVPLAHPGTNGAMNRNDKKKGIPTEHQLDIQMTKSEMFEDNLKK